MVGNVWRLRLKSASKPILVSRTQLAPMNGCHRPTLSSANNRGARWAIEFVGSVSCRKRVTWFEPIQVLIGSPCIIYLATGPLCHGHDTRTPLQSSLQPYPLPNFTFDLFVLSKSYHPFYLPPNLTFAYYQLLPSLLDRRWFSHSFQVYFVTHYELIQSFKALDLCALCFPEYKLAQAVFLQVQLGRKSGRLSSMYFLSGR